MHATATATAALFVAAAAAALAAPPAEVRLGSINWNAVYPDDDVTGWGAPQAYAVHEINSRSDILPRTNLSLLWSNPGRVPGQTIVAALDMLDPSDSRPAICAVIGCVHSNNAIALSNYLSAVKVPQLGWSATSAELSDKSVHPFYSRTSLGALAEAKSMVEFFKVVGWRHAAVVHGNDDFGRGMSDALQTYGHSDSVVFQAFTVPWTIVTGQEQEAYKALESIRDDTDHRIIVLHGTRWMMYPIFAAARELGMLDGTYQYVLTSSPRALVHTAEPPGWPIGTLVVGVRLPTREWQPFADLEDGIAAWNASQSGRGWDSRALNAYDAVWAMAHALHALLEDPAGPRDHYNGTLLLETLRGIEFDGAAGHVAFNEVGDAVVSMEYGSVVGNNEAGVEDIATFVSIDAVTGEITSTGQPVWNYGGGAAPLDEPPSETREAGSSLVAATHAAVAVTLAACVACAVLVQRHHDHPVIRASTPAFLQLILFGCAVCAASASVFALGPDTEGVCSAVPFMLSMAFVLVVGPLLVKTYRLHLIFNGRRMVVKKITTGFLFAVVAAAAVFELVLHGVWLGVDRPEGVLVPVVGSPFTNVYKCQMDQPEVWWLLILVPKAAALMIGAYLAYKVRNLRSSFNESKAIAYALYLIFFLSLIVIPVASMSEDRPDMALLVTAFGTVAGTLSLLAVVYGGKFWSILVTEAWREQKGTERTTTVQSGIESPAAAKRSPRAATTAGTATSDAGTPKTSGLRAAKGAPSRIDVPNRGAELAPVRPAGVDPSSAPGSPAPPRDASQA